MRFAVIVLKEGRVEPTVEEAQKVLYEVLRERQDKSWATTILNYIIQTQEIAELYGNCYLSLKGGLDEELSLKYAKKLAQDVRPDDEWHVIEYLAPPSKYHCCIGYKKEDVASKLDDEWQSL